MGCPYCKTGIKLKYKCTNCGAVWCNNGMCRGSKGKLQQSRHPNNTCYTCRKKGIQKIQCHQLRKPLLFKVKANCTLIN